MTDRVLHLDIETGSRSDLKKEGLYKYAESESTFMNVACYAFGKDAPVTVWVPRRTLPKEVIYGMKARRPNNPLIISPVAPPELLKHILARKEVRAHNAMFERRVLLGPAGQEIGFPEMLASQMVCTMFKAASHGLPSALEHLANALGTHPKKATGANDMRYTSKPRKDGTFVTPEEEPERFVRLYDYCIDDVEAERAADGVIPELTTEQIERYILDQRINDRGWQVDLESVANAHELVRQYKDELIRKCMYWTRSREHPQGIAPGQTAKLANWARDNGYLELEDLKADTVKKAVKDPNCPPRVARLLTLFSTFNMKAVAKFPPMMRAACKDGRLHGMFLINAADTGRYSSKIVQLHNLYRPKIDDPEVAVEIFRSRKLEDVRFYYGGDEVNPGVDPMKVLASTVRSMLVAGPGKILVYPDFAGIEARVNAWLWGEDWKMAAYKAYDTLIPGMVDEKGEPARKGPDLYKVAYAKSFNIAPQAVDKNGRQAGKVMELSLGYQGGVDAFIKMAENNGVDLAKMAAAGFSVLPEDVKREAADMWEWAIKKKKATHELPLRTFIVLDSFKRLWRRSHPKIVQGWADLNQCALDAVNYKGQTFTCAKKKISMRVWKQWLCLQLPSGRVLWYFRPEIKNNAVRFWGTDTNTRRWCLTSTYGGKLDENVVQAISFDLLDYAMKNLEAANYPLVGHVHDEPVAETLINFGSFAEVRRIMSKKPHWAYGLPLAVDGHRKYRYRK